MHQTSSDSAQAPGGRRAAADVRRLGLAMAGRFLFAGACFTLLMASQADTATPLPAPEIEELRAWRAELGAPTRLAEDDEGVVYVSDPARGQVVARRADGAVSWRRSGLGSPLGLAVDTGGRLLVGDASTGAVTAWDTTSWTAAYVLGVGAGEFGMPVDIAVAADTGRIYVADATADRVKVYEPGGAASGSFGGSGAESGQFDHPVALDIDPATGSVHVVDQRNRRVQIFGADGTWLAEFGEYGDEEGQFQSPQGIWTDPNSRIWVVDAGRTEVMVFDTDGNFLSSFGSYGTEPGSLRLPADLLIDRDGRLFVASANNARLEIFGVDVYSDPEAWAPASLAADSSRVDPEGSFGLRVEIPGYKLEEVDSSTITANGVALLTVGDGDQDGDGEPELLLEFDGAALAATLDGDAGEVVVSGAMASLGFVTEPLAVEVAETPADSAPADAEGVFDLAGQGTELAEEGPGGPGAAACGCASTPSWSLPLLLLPLLRRRAAR